MPKKIKMIRSPVQRWGFSTVHLTEGDLASLFAGKPHSESDFFLFTLSGFPRLVSSLLERLGGCHHSEIRVEEVTGTTGT